MVVTYAFDLFEYSDDFPLLRGALAAHEVSEAEGEEVRRRGPLLSEVLLVEGGCHLEQAVDEAVEVLHDPLLQTHSDQD
jgi:hypothetical protein